MKKMITCFIALLILVGCSSTKVVTKDEDIKIADNSNNTIVDNTNNNIETETTEEDKKTIEFNEKFSVGDVCEIVFESAEWVDSLLPSNTTGVYSYYEDEDGETYCVIHGKLTNVATDNLDVQWLAEAKIVLNDKYNFDATFALESNDGTDFYGNAKPLQTLNLIVYSSVTDDAKELVNNLRLDFSMLSSSDNINNFYSDTLQHSNYSLIIQ